MSRPIRKRRLGFIPHNRYFCPDILCGDGYDEVIIKHEELESIRLTDLERKEQTEAAQLMEISRGTYQRILVSAHKKIADALVNGRGIKVEGGNYVLNNCLAHCENCNFNWEAPCNELYSENSGECPKCGSVEISCKGSQGDCLLGETRHKAIQGCRRNNKHHKDLSNSLSSDDRNKRLQAILINMRDNKKIEFLKNQKSILKIQLSDIKKMIELYDID